VASSSTNKLPAMIDRPLLNSALLTVASGQVFITSLIPTAIGNATKILDVDSALTDTSISGAYVDEIWLRYSKEAPLFVDPVSPTTGTYSQVGLDVVIVAANANVKVGQKIYVNFTSGTGTDELLEVTDVTASNFTATATISATTSGNCSVYLPVDICFYLTNVSTITNTNQFFPLFTISIDSNPLSQYYSLTLNEKLPLINHPVPHAGANFAGANNEVAPKNRGLVLQRGQAIYAAANGATALTNGFYINAQGGYY
jgi:hypothetical protein